MLRSTDEAHQREWSVLLKVGINGPTITDLQLDEIRNALAQHDVQVDGGGKDFTIRLWRFGRSAVEATVESWLDVQDCLAALGLAGFPVRAHTAEPSQRVTGYEGTQARANNSQDWSVLIKAEIPEALSESQRQALLGFLPGSDKSIVGSKTSLVARFWMSAPSLVSAVRVSAHVVASASEKAGIKLDVVRSHVASAAARRLEIYAGVFERMGVE